MSSNCKVMIVAGTRPELIKLAPIFWEFERRDIEYTFVWSGQHYDYEMSKVFMEQLKIPELHVDLGIGSGSHAIQTAKAMVGIEEAIRKYKPKTTLALGDTNTVLATALASVKSLVPFIHVEAGLRSWNYTMPEEINRKVADHIAQLLFTPSIIATINTIAEGISLQRVFYVGNTIVDVIMKTMPIVKQYTSKVEDIIKDVSGAYILVTVHRQENVDNPYKLRAIVEALIRLAQDYSIILPLHPRTRRRLQEYGLICRLRENSNIKIVKPLGYFEFLCLLKKALVVLTDSGGVQEEAFTLKIPTITIRYNTERPETILYGCNVLAGADVETIVSYTEKMIELRNKITAKLNSIQNPYGDGEAAKKLANILIDFLEQESIESILEEPDLRDTPYITYIIKGIAKLDPYFDEVLSYIDKSGRLTINQVQAATAYIRSKIRVAKPWESMSE